MKATQINFRPLEINDLSLLHSWFHEPFILKHYARNEVYSLQMITDKYLPRILGKESISSFIIKINGIDNGFIQYYQLSEFLPEGMQDDSVLFKEFKASECVGIDLFIASPELRFKGLGARVIQKFIADFLTNYKIVLVDPQLDNTGAIRAYEKAGFQKTDLSILPDFLILSYQTSVIF